MGPSALVLPCPCSRSVPHSMKPLAAGFGAGAPLPHPTTALGSQTQGDHSQASTSRTGPNPPGAHSRIRAPEPSLVSPTPLIPPQNPLRTQGVLRLPRRPQLPVCLWLPQLRRLHRHPPPHLRMGETGRNVSPPGAYSTPYPHSCLPRAGGVVLGQPPADLTHRQRGKLGFAAGGPGSHHRQQEH